MPIKPKAGSVLASATEIPTLRKAAAKKKASATSSPKQITFPPAAPPPDLGMGVTLQEPGAWFKLWAPNASKVSVVGSFNGWSDQSNVLLRGDGGYWYGYVPEAKAGDEYKYALARGRKKFQRNDPYARQLTGSRGNTLILANDFDWGNDEFRMTSWNNMVLLEMHVGTFNVKEEGKPGDLYGLIEKLPYLRDLGINALNVMPLNECPGGFSWGYNPAHPFALENQYGGAKAFKELVKAAHQHGIAIILDVVYNHFGPDRLDLWQFDGPLDGEPDRGGVYFYNDWRAETPWGDTRPDLDRGEVRQYLFDNAMMWLDEYRVDGLRIDSVSHIRNVFGKSNDPEHDLPEGWSFLQWINDEIRRRTPWKISIAEDPNGSEWLVKTTGEGGAGFNVLWDNWFVHTVHDAVVTRDDQHRNMEGLADVIRHCWNGDPFQRIVYSESHDEVANGSKRIAEEIAPDHVDNFFSKKRSALGTALVLTSPGIPMLFQGQELLADKWFDPQIPLDWTRAETFRGLVSLHRDLIALRQNRHGHTRGLSGPNVNVFHVNQADKVIAFHRWQNNVPGDSVVVVMNFANRSYDHYRIGLPDPGVWKVRLNSDWEGYDSEFTDHPSFDTEAEPDSYDEMIFRGSVGLGPYSFVILSQDMPS